MSDKLYPTIESLEAVHTFPCWFTIKAIGANTEVFVGAVKDAVSIVTLDPTRLKTKSRKSSTGKHISMTLEVFVTDASQVQQLYAQIKEIDALHYIL